MVQDPPAPPTLVIYNAQPKTSQNIRESYAARSATVLGSILILGGLAFLIMDFVFGSPIYISIWTSVIFILCGGLALCGARSGSPCLLVATLVMTVICAVTAGALFMYTIYPVKLWPCRNGYGSTCRDNVAVFGLQVFVALAILVAAIVLSSLTCRALCCRASQDPGRMHTVNGLN